MKRFVPVNDTVTDRWFAVEQDGELKCSCGRQLVKLDSKTYKCPGGLPIYRVDEGEVMVDKFGRLMLRHKSHESGESGAGSGR